MPISWVDCNVIAANMDVNATKIVSITQLVQQVINLCKWVLIRSSLLIHGPIVYEYSQCSIFFPSKKDESP